ncbi:protein of unknown function [Paraburkholderia dioscoreae]|uniref:Uncharacterized protein n=1 Tax=Paraburkholderia dioscoreae TaxID=2604047 RepID=A0A5Q4ZPH7_9BURK|nr:protein of unknown function [Paraburkholderia dioscoreae]
MAFRVESLLCLPRRSAPNYENSFLSTKIVLLFRLTKSFYEKWQKTYAISGSCRGSRVRREPLTIFHGDNPMPRPGIDKSVFAYDMKARPEILCCAVS